MLLIALAFLASSSAAAPVAIAILPNSSFGSWEGWGVSLAWSGVVWGSSAPLADAIFSLADAVELPNLGAVPGLGFNIARYNVGGSSNKSADGNRIVYSKNIPWWKQARGFQIDWNSNDTHSQSWDFSTDANQVTLLQAAKARGANRIEFFSNTPLWWQLVNHNPSGSDDGSSDNLQAWNRGNHARYMASVAAWSRDEWGVTPTSIELFNEPIANWWKASGTQEGCHFDASTQAAVLAALPAELARVNLTGVVRVAASDESQVDMALATWRAFDAPTRAIIDQVNVHGYQQGGDRAALYREVAAAGKVLRDSEYGDGDGSGATLATSILLDFAQLHPRGWCYWQTVDVADGWGMLKGDADSGALLAVNTKHYVIAMLSRHIREGMEIISADDPRSSTVAALDAARRVLVLVTANTQGGAVDVELSLAAFTSAPAAAALPAWVTSMASAKPDGAAAHTPLAGVALGADRLIRLHLAARSIVTIEVPGVVA